MKKLYIILMHTKTIPARFIKLFTNYEYSHVAISLDKKCNTIYSFGRRKPTSILNAGFTIEYKDGEFFKLFNKTICKIYELEITDEQYDSVKKNLMNMKKHIDEYKYDYFGIIPRYFGIPLTFKNRYVCSYFVADILERSNIYDFKKENSFIKPEDFAEIFINNEIYSGKYLSYK